MQRRPRGETDITTVFGTVGPGSIPGGGTNREVKHSPNAASALVLVTFAHFRTYVCYDCKMRKDKEKAIELRKEGGATKR